ncbi:hypothetical protein VSP9026_01843 [Vibrio spartinae]|uniref:Uncharacterized protein n=1 Tax=Vibrio spartinae TaxID=1918945 RepID=A0A1N6M488_9VIBR|nr:hypothetical protein VSP9026_01843 [Vibrio spartinae]
MFGPNGPPRTGLHIVAMMCVSCLKVNRTDTNDAVHSVKYVDDSTKIQLTHHVMIISLQISQHEERNKIESLERVEFSQG